MVLKIYFGDKPVFLCDEITQDIEILRHHPDTVFIDEMSSSAIGALLHEVAKPGFHTGILYSRDIDPLKKLFLEHFTVIQAAGGLIKNEKEEILMIFRRGVWDLPKGKKEEGETPETCAVREVMEETGLKEVRLLNLLTVTYHTYNQFGKGILKETYWYRMKAPSGQSLQPQTEEDIHRIEWVGASGLNEKLSNTFPSIKDVLTAAGDIAG